MCENPADPVGWTHWHTSPAARPAPGGRGLRRRGHGANPTGGGDEMDAQQRAGSVYAVCFSGGKDSMLALDRALRSGLAIARLVTLYDEASERVRFHAVPVSVMRAQAQALSLPMSLLPTTPATFERVFLAALASLRAEGI